MKKRLMLLVILIFALSILRSNSQALILNSPDSLWVRTIAPYDFETMTLFWGLFDIKGDEDMDYYIYGPEGYSGPPSVDYFHTNLKTFYGKQVLFEIRAIDGTFSIMDDAFIWDAGIPGGIYGYSGVPFYFGFCNLDDLGNFSEREVISYSEGEILISEPDHGNLFYSQPLYLGNPRDYYFRCDFIHSEPEPIPEPGTLLLLGTGLVGLAGYAKFGLSRRKK